MTEEHYCKIHSCKFYKNEKDGRTWYSHKIKDGSGYCNEPKGEETMVSTPIKTPASSEVKPEPPAQPAAVAESKMTDGKWIEKDRITRKSIERQTSLNAAVEVAGLIKEYGKDITTVNIIATAKLFEAYLEGKEVQKARIINLVEAAKKLNVEIEEEVN